MYEKFTLPNGVRVVTDKMSTVRSASLGVFVGVGSRHETATLSGAAHFLEHLAFKGTPTRSAEELAQFMDSAGGQINAYTSNALTCFHGRVVDTRLAEFAEMLGDITLNSKLDEADIISERSVIDEEIDMYEDSPENVVAERLMGTVYADTSLGRSILGTHETLTKLDEDALRQFKADRYVGGATVIALAGSFTDEDLKRICGIFAKLPSGWGEKYPAVQYNPGRVATNRDIEQVHMALGFPSVSSLDERRFAMGMLCDILGGGMSSRLFQEVREKRGLCYSVYAQNSTYIDTGILTINTATNSESQSEMLGAIIDELKRFRDNGITEDELRRERELVSASVLMSLESSSSRMSRAGNNEMLHGRIPSTEETLARFEAVTAQDIAELAEEILRLDLMSVSIVGRSVEDDFEERIAADLRSAESESTQVEPTSARDA